jgi:transposase
MILTHPSTTLIPRQTPVSFRIAACIRVVQDNLSIHTAGALYQAFAPAEARRILRRHEFHYTPKHASWLNMVECEISVLQRQCLGRRIDDPKGFEKRSQHGNGSEIKRETASNGCSQPTKPAPNSAAPIRLPPKSQNHCDEPLDGLPRRCHERRRR